MTINDILNESELLLEAGINYHGDKPKTAKVLMHDDFDGLMSAVAISMQITKQFKIPVEKIEYAALSDKNYKNSNEKLLKKVPGQLLVVVDFNRFEKSGETKNIDVATDHHKQEDGAEKRKGLKVDDSFRSDAEHISTKIARGFMNSSDLEAVSTVDSAGFDDSNLFTNHDLDLKIALKNEKTGDKKKRVAIVANLLLHQIIRAYKTKKLNVVYGIIRSMVKKPTMVHLYTILKKEIKKLKDANIPDIKDIEDFKKGNEERVAKSMEKDEKGDYKIKPYKPSENLKGNDIFKSDHFKDIAINRTFGGDGRYDAFLDKSVKAAFRDYGNFWQISKRPASKMKGNLIKISQDAFKKAIDLTLTRDKFQKTFYFKNNNFSNLLAVAQKEVKKDFDKIGGHEGISNIGMVNLKKGLEDFYNLSTAKAKTKGSQGKVLAFKIQEIKKALKKEDVKLAYAAILKRQNRLNKEYGIAKKVTPEEVTPEAISEFCFKGDPKGYKLIRKINKAAENSNKLGSGGVEHKFYITLSRYIVDTAEKTGSLKAMNSIDASSKEIAQRQGAINSLLKAFKTNVNHEIGKQVQSQIDKEKPSLKNDIKSNAGVTKK